MRSSASSGYDARFQIRGQPVHEAAAAGMERITRLATTLLSCSRGCIIVGVEEGQIALLPGDPGLRGDERFLAVLLGMHAEGDDKVITIQSSARDTLLRGAALEAGIGALASAPLISPSGVVLGGLIALNDQPIEWSQAQLDGLVDLAALAATLLDQAAEPQENGRYRQAYERFRSLFEGGNDLVAIVSEGGKIEYITPSVGRALGLTPEYLHQTSAFALLHPDDAPGVVSRFSAFLRSNRGGSGELRLRHASGHWRTFEVRARNMFHDPAVAGLVLTARDVTEERAAQQMQSQLNAFLEASPDFVAIFNSFGRAIAINRAFRSILGLSSDESLEQLTLADLFPESVTEMLLREGIPTAVRNGSWSGEAHVQTADGRRIHVSQVLLAHRSPSGTLEFLSTLGRDTTRQKEAENALRRSEAHFRSLIEHALDIITIMDVEGRVLFASPSVERLLGRKSEEVVGTIFFPQVHPDDRDTARLRFQQVLRGKYQGSVETRVRHRDGSWRVLEWAGENLLDDPAVGGVVVNSRDVTERRSAEEALIESQQQLLQSQKMEAVGRLAGGIAHDFNNLLTAIKGFTELLLLDFEADDPRRAFAAEIQSATGRAATLTRQLLAFSRRQVLQPVVLDLNATVSDMEIMLQRMIGEDIRMVCKLEPRLGHVRADPGQLEQVLMNLVVNARDAMPRGGRLKIRTANARLPGNETQTYSYVVEGSYILLEVSDTGEGMSREVRDRVFEPFFTTKEQGQGTGLGLSTVYGIVKQSGGYIWIDSSTGTGSTFRIYLPRVHEPLSSRHAATPLEGPALRGTGSVLLVEDEEAVRLLVQRVLERAGYEVTAAASGGEALELIGDGLPPFDLLLTDVVMPGMSGRELADRLTERTPELPVLYMSGYTGEAIVRHGILEPGVALVEKPFTPDTILRRVRELLERKEQVKARGNAPISEPE